MILRSKPGFRDVLFAVNGSILPSILPLLAAMTLISIVAVGASEEFPGIFAKISAMPFTLIGIALSVFMSFRNSTYYDRWWEGRKLWGDIVVAHRSIAREISTLDPQQQAFLVHGLCGFSAGLVARLRDGDEAAEIARWFELGPGERGPNPTNDVLYRMGKYCLDLVRTENLSPIHYSVIEGQMTLLSKAQAGCERIRGTPVPFAYSLLLHRTALIFCVTLPFALAGSLHWWTILPVLLVAYTFFGLDALGHQLEDPFGREPNCLPLDSIQRNLERELLSTLGERPLPEPILAVNKILT